jgi:hypothetical protein
MAEDLEFEEPPPDGIVADAVAQESRMYRPSEPQSHNCFFMPIGKRGYLSWQSDNHLAVLALIMVAITILALLFFALIGLSSSAPAWIPEIAKVLGQALLAIVGAVLGAGAAGRR